MLSRLSWLYEQSPDPLVHRGDSALQRDGWVVVRRKGSHIRLQKHLPTEVLKVTVPAHRPLKRSTLAHILKQARLSDKLPKIFSMVEPPQRPERFVPKLFGELQSGNWTSLILLRASMNSKFLQGTGWSR